MPLAMARDEKDDDRRPRPRSPLRYYTTVLVMALALAALAAALVLHFDLMGARSPTAGAKPVVAKAKEGDGTWSDTYDTAVTAGTNALVTVSYVAFGILMLSDLYLGVRGFRFFVNTKRFPFVMASRLLYLASIVLLFAGSFVDGGDRALPFIWMGFLAFVFIARLMYHVAMLTVVTVGRDTAKGISEEGKKAGRVRTVVGGIAAGKVGLGGAAETRAVYKVERFLREARFGVGVSKVAGVEGRMVGGALNRVTHKAVMSAKALSSKKGAARRNANKVLAAGGFAQMPEVRYNTSDKAFRLPRWMRVG